MAVTSENIRLGAADVTFNGNDLGSTKGGVEVEVSTERYTVTVDQTGETPLKDIIIGTTVTVTVPLAETDLDRLQTMMAQSVTNAASVALPTGWLVNNVAGYAVGSTSIDIDTGSNDPAVGDKFTFANHTTTYRVTAYSSPTLTFVRDDANTGGLVAAVADDEALTFTQLAKGIEIRTGVNTDLLSSAAALRLHPTGVADGTRDQDFYAFLAAPIADFAFAYELNAERVYEVTFQCYPDTTNNNRIAIFGDWT